MSVQLSRGRSLPLTSVSSSQLNKTSSLSSSHLRGKKIELQKLDEGNSAFHTATLVKSKQKRKETAKGKTSAFEFDPVVEVFENSKIMEVMQQFLMPCEVSDVAQLTREIHSSVDRTVDYILNELDSVLPSTGIEVPVGLTPLKRLEYILKSLCEFTGEDPKEIKISLEFSENLLSILAENKAKVFDILSRLDETVVNDDLASQIASEGGVKEYFIKNPNALKTWIQGNESLSQLTELDLSGSELTFFPHELSESFPRLKKISIAENRIPSLPNNFGYNWTELEEISFGGNPIDFDRLPCEFGSCWTQIKTVDFTSSQTLDLLIADGMYS